MNQLTPLQLKALVEIRKHGKSLPIRGKDLANIIGLKPRQTGKEGADMRSVINALRVKGYPICASGDGYWWPSSRMELSAYIVGFDSRVSKQLQAVNGLKASFDKIELSVAEEAKKNTITYVQLGEKVLKIPGNLIEQFLAKYPGARILRTA